MPSGVYIRTDKHRIAISNRKLNGYIPWNKGKALPESMRDNISKGNKGKKRSIKAKNNISLSLKGKPKSEEHIAKIIIARKKQVGSKASNWKGDDVGYGGVHHWVYNQLGKSDECENCGNNTLSHRSYHWANISGKYLRDIGDWARLCVYCHKLIDNNVKKTLETKRLRGLIR